MLGALSVEHYLFDAFAFTVALVELIHIYRKEREGIGRRWFIPTLIGLLVASGAIVASDWAQHRTALRDVRVRITDILRTPQTFDEIAHKLPYDDMPMVSEALGDLIHSAKVNYDVIVLAQRDDSIQHEVGLYSAKTEQLHSICP